MGDAFILYFVITYLVNECSMSFGYLICAISGNISTAFTLSAPLLIPLITIGGFYINTKSIPVWLIWLKYISWIFYSFQAMNINQWRYSFDETGDEKYEKFQLGCRFCNGTIAEYKNCPEEMQIDGDIVLDAIGFKKENFELDISLLVVLIIFYRILAFIVMKFRFKRTN